jgi:hypothetical protein
LTWDNKKDFALRREGILHTQGKCFPAFSGPDNQQSHLELNRAWLLVKLVADVSVVHVMLVLQNVRVTRSWRISKEGLPSNV